MPRPWVQLELFPDLLEPHQQLIETWAEKHRREQEDEYYLRLERAWETHQPKRDEESEWDSPQSRAERGEW